MFDRPAERFCHSLLEQPMSISNRQEASQEIKVKLNESRQLKLYQVKPTERKFNSRILLKR